MKRFVCKALIMAVAFLLLIGSAAATYGGGKPVVRTNKQTSTVIIGDSRIVQMYQVGYKSFSTIAVAGGMYSLNNEYMIQSKKYANSLNKTAKKEKASSRHTVIKQSVKDALKKHKKCRVIILATINECKNIYTGSKDFPKKQSKATAKFAKSIADMKVKKGGKVYKPKVYVIKSPKAINKGIGKKHAKKDVDKYNKAVKKYAKKYKYTFVKVREPKKKEFSKDGIHFKAKKSGYNKYLWKKFKSLKF